MAVCVAGALSAASMAQADAPIPQQQSVWTADASAPYLPYADAWPARWRRDGLEGTGVVIPRTATSARMTMVRLFGSAKPSPADVADLGELAGPEQRDGFRFERAGAVLFAESKVQRRSAGLNEGPSLAAGPDTGEVFVFASARAEAPPRALDRTFFAYYPPAPARKSDPTPELRAVALLMPGLLGMPETTMDPLTRTLRNHGIGVLRMLCQPARFTERIEFTIDRDQMEASAAAVAACFNDRTAECAYAAEAAWRQVESRHPGAAALPRLVIGMSGGALTIPTVVAREPHKYRAATLIGGGGDFWLINERSNYRTNVDSVRCAWKGATPTQAELAEFDRLYLARAYLDSYHTAPALNGIRTLMVHGELDRAVPAELGELLWERVGNPERWSYAASHEMLCGLLPTEFARLNAWIEQALFGAAQNSGQPALPPR